MAGASCVSESTSDEERETYAPEPYDPVRVGGVAACIEITDVRLSYAYFSIIGEQGFVLPAWDDWADILVRGLMAVTASGIYWLPVGVLALIGLFPATRLVAFFALIAAIGLGLALSIGHVRFARSDRYG